MSAKMTVSVYDDLHHRSAQGLIYDLWRIENHQNRVKVKNGTINDEERNLLIETNRSEDLGSFELVLYVNDYFQQFSDYTEIQQGKMILPFGMNRLAEENHLNIHIQPTCLTCTL